MEWDPAKYVEFGDYRNRPFFDLTSRVLAEAPRRVVDLGCGPGNLTATLARRWPDAQVVGLDSSPQMIETARNLSGAPDNLSFALADIAGWRPEPGNGCGGFQCRPAVGSRAPAADVLLAGCP